MAQSRRAIRCDRTCIEANALARHIEYSSAQVWTAAIPKSYRLDAASELCKHRTYASLRFVFNFVWLSREGLHVCFTKKHAKIFAAFKVELNLIQGQVYQYGQTYCVGWCIFKQVGVRIRACLSSLIL